MSESHNRNRKRAGHPRQPNAAIQGPQHAPVAVQPHSTQNEICPLSSVRAGTHVRIITVTAGDGLRARLAALGLYPGAVCRVISNSGWGPFVVAIRNARMLLGRGMVERIKVEALAPSALAQ